MSQCRKRASFKRAAHAFVGESHPAIANLVFCRRVYELIPFQLFGFPLFWNGAASIVSSNPQSQTQSLRTLNR